MNEYEYAKKVNNAGGNKTVLDTLVKAKNNYVSGLQLDKDYRIDWNEIKSIVAMHDLNLNEHSPYMLIDGLKNARLAQKLAENPRGYRRDDVFLAVLCSMPIYCRHVGSEKFENFMDTKEFDLIMDLHGLPKDKDKRMEEIIGDISFGKKK